MIDRYRINFLWSSHVGQVAQSVEQRTENPRVGGSIPSLTTKMRASKEARFFIPELLSESKDIFFHRVRGYL